MVKKVFMKKMQSNTKSSKAAKTREHILRSAFSIMEKKGYASTTIRDICAEANVSIGTFYIYFPTKNDIFFDIYKKADDYFADTVVTHFIAKTVPEKIIEFFRHYARLNLNTGIEITKILYNPDNLWFIKKRKMQTLLEEVIREGQMQKELTSDMTAAEMVDFLFILARGCCYNWCIMQGKYDLESQMVFYIEKAISALKKP
jgi:TetR/AcrR family fatty acid metabolism transcriptional regulator